MSQISDTISPKSNSQELLSDILRLEKNGILQFWESEFTRPKVGGATAENEATLEKLTESSFLQTCLSQPFKTLETIREEQFKRIQFLVELAYNEVPVYRKKYDAVGFKPEHLQTWADFEKIPVITKDEFLAAGIENCVASRWKLDQLFQTRSFGTSGKTLPIRVNLDSILVDTLQGIRQFWQQSGMRLNADHLTAMIYTVPWWFESVAGKYPSAFISGLITPEKVVAILNEIKPHIVSCYPTNLKSLIPFRDQWNRENLHTAVVHSEGSSPLERKLWSQQLGVPVLDEYSSEEGTRMALELPCGHYHVVEDAVYMEIIDPATLQVQPNGQTGLTVITNMLNEGMPFIRYVQGDYAKRPAVAPPCLTGWSQLESLEGRVNDSFLTHEGRAVPAGSILDVTYRWMYDSGINLDEFEMIQVAPDQVRAHMAVRNTSAHPRVRASVLHLEELLEVCVGHPMKVEATLAEALPKRTGKRRLIRREFGIANLASTPLVN